MGSYIIFEIIRQFRDVHDAIERRLGAHSLLLTIDKSPLESKKKRSVSMIFEVSSQMRGITYGRIHRRSREPSGWPPHAVCF